MVPLYCYFYDNKYISYFKNKQDIFKIETDAINENNNAINNVSDDYDKLFIMDNLLHKNNINYQATYICNIFTYIDKYIYSKYIGMLCTNEIIENIINGTKNILNNFINTDIYYNKKEKINMTNYNIFCNDNFAKELHIDLFDDDDWSVTFFVNLLI